MTPVMDKPVATGQVHRCSPPIVCSNEWCCGKRQHKALKDLSHQDASHLKSAFILSCTVGRFSIICSSKKDPALLKEQSGYCLAKLHVWQLLSAIGLARCACGDDLCSSLCALHSWALDPLVDPHFHGAPDKGAGVKVSFLVLPQPPAWHFLLTIFRPFSITTFHLQALHVQGLLVFNECLITRMKLVLANLIAQFVCDPLSCMGTSVEANCHCLSASFSSNLLNSIYERNPQGANWGKVRGLQKCKCAIKFVTVDESFSLAARKLTPAAHLWGRSLVGWLRLLTECTKSIFL